MLLRDSKRENFAEHDRANHAGDAEEARQGTLKLSLFGSCGALAHQRLHGRASQSPQRDQGTSDQEKGSRSRTGEQAEPEDAEAQSGKECANLAKAPVNMRINTAETIDMQTPTPASA